MSSKTAIQFKKEELQELLSDPYSQLFLKQNVKHQVALTPSCLTDPEAAIYAILDRDLMTYLPKHKGILLSYKKVRRLENTGSIQGDNYHIFIDLLLDLYIFAPTVGCILKGIVNKKSPDGIGCLVHKGFNIAIPRPWDGTNNEWSGNFVQIGQDVMLKVEILNFSGRLPYIRGKIVMDEFSTMKIHKKGKKSKDKLQAIDSEATEMRSDKLAVSAEVPSMQSKKNRPASISNKEKYNCSLSETSTADEVAAMLKKHMNKKSRKYEMEPSLVPQMYNNVSTVMDETLPKEKKKRSRDKLRMEQSSMSEFSNNLTTVHEAISPIQKKKKKSKEKLEMDQSLLPVTGTMETAASTTILNEKTRKKSKDKSETDHNLLPSTSNLSTIADEFSTVQKKKKKTKKKSMDKLEKEQSKLLETTSDYSHVLMQSKTKHSEATRFGNGASTVLTDFSSIGLCVDLSGPFTSGKKGEEISSLKRKFQSVEDTIVSSGTTVSITNTHERKHKKRKISSCEETVVVSDVNNVCADESNGIQLSSIHNKVMPKERVDNEISTFHAHKAKKAKKNKKNEEYLASTGNILENIDDINVTSIVNIAKKKKETTFDDCIDNFQLSVDHVQPAKKDKKSKRSMVNQDSKLKGVDNTQGSFDTKKMIKELLRAQKKNIVDNDDYVKLSSTHCSTMDGIRSNENVSESDGTLGKRRNSKKLSKTSV